MGNVGGSPSMSLMQDSGEPERLYGIVHLNQPSKLGCRRESLVRLIQFSVSIPKGTVHHVRYRRIR